ncbi:hypothetical protein [Acetobacter papayae]
MKTVRAAGQRVTHIDCGGGLGIAYGAEAEGQPEALAAAIRAELGDLDVKLAIEPGRWLAGPSGVLLSSVILRKEYGMQTPFVVTDAAMNDLLRPSMYDAWHGSCLLHRTVWACPAHQRMWSARFVKAETPLHVTVPCPHCHGARASPFWTPGLTGR